MSASHFLTKQPIVVETFSQNHNLIVAQVEKWWDHQSHKDASSGNHECLFKQPAGTDHNANMLLFMVTSLV